MAVGVFANCIFFLKVNHLSAQEKKRLKACIKNNGGTISFVLNKQCTHVITENADALPARHLQNIKKNEIPIVDVDFILKSGNKTTKSCEIDLGKQTNLSEAPLKKETCMQRKSKGKINKQIPQETAKGENKKPKNGRIFIECDPDSVNFHQEFEIAKYAAFEKTLANLPNEVAVIELQCLKEHFQIMVHVGLSDGIKKKLQYLQFETSEEACEKFQQIFEDLKKKNYKLRSGVPQVAVHLASGKLQEMLLQDAITATSVAQEVATVVELLWLEALGHLDNILLHPVNKISLNDVSKAEGILLQVRKALDKGENLETLKTIMAEFYQILPHRNGTDFDISKKLLSAKEDLCQVIRDIVSVCETKMSSTSLTSLAKYRALRCMIQHVDPSSAEYIQVKEQVLQINHSDTPISILNICRVGRASEATDFESNIGNVQSLLHASAACNYVGILSRGLLLPKMVVEDRGVERTDIGNLGSGIYFSDSISTSMKYSSPTQMDGSRLLVVCDVALGDCLEMHKKDFSLTNAPSGYQSVHGIRQAPGACSDFEDDEYVVYKTSQVKMKYIVQYCTPEDNICHFCPELNDADLKDVLPRPSDLSVQPQEDELLDIKPLEEVKGGLLDSSGNPIPLEGVYIKGKILDLVAQVVVFQKYTNRSTVPIEAKYVFPLDSTAAVCGFEAFINGKHIIGEVKEKKEAHREYREAVQKGHGAYLMDQDAPDVFTVSVGNLPPNATVLIKITYITELTITCYGPVSFTVPGAVAPWQEDKALNENTQDTVEKICVNEEDAKKGEFTLDLSVEMPFKITQIWSYCHNLKIKKTDCKAVVSTVKNSTLDSNGFDLLIQLAEQNIPRMWVEKHPEKESEACMLVFQPDFETEDEDPNFDEIIICLDCSNSMSSVMKQAKTIGILAVNALSYCNRVNIIKFGSSYEEFSLISKQDADQTLWEDFIKSAKPTMGNTDFWKPLRSLSLLAPSKGVRNIILISDGHIQDESRTLQIVKNNVKHTRVFTCGVGSTANRHMLRSLAKYGSGTFEYFDEKSKYSWDKKIKLQLQRIESPGCNAVSIKWQQFGANAPVPVQAPAHIQSIFKSERVLIYGFVPHCTQAALRALLREQEIDTMVSTTELQKTTGTILHKLTARALIRDYEDGILHENEDEHEMKKHMLKSRIIELSKEYSIVTQFTSFVAIEERDADESPAENPDIQQLMALEDVDILPYMAWQEDPDATDTRMRKRSISEHSTNLDLLVIEECDYREEEFEIADIPEKEAKEKVLKKKRKAVKMLAEVYLAKCSEIEDDLEIETEEKSLRGDSSDIQEGIESLKDCFDIAFDADMSDVPRMEGKARMEPRRKKRPQNEVVSYSQVSRELLVDRDRPVGDACSRPSPALRYLLYSESSKEHASHSGPPLFQQSSAQFSKQATEEHFLGLSPGVQSNETFSGFGAAAPQVSDVKQFLKQAFSGFRAAAPQVEGRGASFSRKHAQFPLPGFAVAKEPLYQAPLALPPVLNRALFACNRTSANLFGSSMAQARPYSAALSVAPSLLSFQLGNMSSTSFLQIPRGESLAPCVKGFFMPAFGMAQMMTFPPPPPPPPGQPPVPVAMRPKTFIQASADPNWAALFELQTPDHYWELEPKLGRALKINVDYLITSFLPGKGLQSLGSKGRDAVLRLIATLLVLQALWLAEELSGIRFKLLLKLDESSIKNDYYWRVQRAIEWARNIDAQYPGICSRIQLGRDWKSATRQLLRIDPLEDNSPFAEAVYGP